VTLNESAGREQRGADPRRIWHRVGVSLHASARLRTRDRRARHVLRSDHQRKPERRLALRERARPAELERDHRALVRREISDADGEHSRPFFLGHRRAISFRDRGLVLRPRLPALAERSANDPAGDLELHAVHRHAIRQGKHVDRLERRRVAVDECLPQLGVTLQADHPRPYFHCLERQLTE
jgi:hypothetical protein